jgi:uncharacterized membrane protein
MRFTNSGAGRFGLAAAIFLTGLIAGSAARAEPMKQEDLENNRQTCMSACIEQTGNAKGCTAYCDCSIKALAQQVTHEEYQAGRVAISSKQQPPQATVDKLTTIAKTCRPQLEQ